ncbi:hypothetical protein, partial [Bartonella sp. CL32QHWL-2]|uniref:hypothetical protein n=1 Tax=Bartonella sp. CL32QHWL-2 TaxID=3243525 RepID=UPI0035CF64C4
RENTFFVPKSLYLSADVTISGDSKNSVVNNLGRNLISKMVVKWGTEQIFDLDEYSHYSTFKDLWLTEEERKDRVFQGIQSKNLRELRSGVADADVPGETANEKTLKKVFDKKYKIPLDFELFQNHAPFYKFPIQDVVIVEITLAPKEEIIVTATTANMGYKLANICFEYDTVTNKRIATQLSNKYNSGFSIYYDWVDHFKTVNVTANETLINENINFPRMSIKGLLLLFVSDYVDGARDSEKFENPEISKVQITIEGVANQVFPEGMRMLDQWEEIKKHFMSEDLKKTYDCYMTMEKYYGDSNHYGLWLDLRTTEDNRLHGSGKKLQNTKDGIQLSVTKKSGKGPYKMHIFVVSDAQVNIQNSQIASLQH